MFRQFTHSVLLIFFVSFLNAQIIFEENFNGISGSTAGGPGMYNFPEGWLLRNVDNRTPDASVNFINDAWERREDFKFNGSDSAAFSTSYYSPLGQADDWMWTPPITIPASGDHVLRWRAVVYAPDFPDGYEVRIMTAPDVPSGGHGDMGNQVTDSDLLFSIPAENPVWTNREIELNDYNGQTVYIAFRNNSNDKFILLIDDVIVANRNYSLDQIIYVKKGATGDGTSWENAIGELADALLMAKSSNETNPGSISQIWVAQGTYRPMYSSIDGNFGNPDGRNNSFLIPPGVNVYGGFEGNETNLEERDFASNATILSGDFLDNDVVTSGSAQNLVISNNEENAYHVVISTSFGNAGKLDGFTIKGGNANLISEVLVNNFAISNSRGAGLFTYNSEFSVENSKFTENNSTGSGAAIHNRNSFVEIHNSEFELNSGGTGGAVFNYSSIVEISNSKFNSNLSKSNGGAVANMYTGTEVNINGCEFTNNYAVDNGGSILNSDNAIVNFTNSKFFNNSAGWMGGAVYTVSSLVEIKNSLFQNNSADLGGAIMVWSNSRNMSLVNTTFHGNTANQGHAIALDFNSNSSAPEANRTVNLYNCIVWNNDEFEGNNNLSDNYGIYNVQNSVIQYPGSGYNINGNYINTNPMFNNPGLNDFGLNENSPAVNSGDNSFFTGLDENTLDLAGNHRLSGSSIDMGAYEFQESMDDCPDETIWNGGAWSNGIPDLNKKAVIDGALILDSDLNACELEITVNGSLDIPSGFSFVVNGSVTNNAEASAFVVASGANLIQNETVENTGAITVIRDSQPMKRLDYTLWSSPIVAQNLFGFSPETVNGVTNYPGSPGRIYIYDGASDTYINPNPFDENTVMNGGVGYLFRAPNNYHATNPQVYEGTFTGVPNNGFLNVNTFAGGFNSIGNPYPSNIDAVEFLSANFGVSTLYFWNNTGVAGNNYATYTEMGGTAAGGGSEVPDGIISVGQGFIVATTTNSVNFDNSMRTVNDGIFFKGNQAQKHRFWLDLTNENNEKFNQILIGYMDGATNGIDNQIDGKQFGYEGSSLYNLINEEKYTIQGRGLPFENTDVVKLGFKAVQAGKFNLSLNNFDGLFAEGETIIYLKDKLLNISHNLMESNYSFESERGEFNERFEIVYEEDETMNSDDLDANNIQIYTDKNYIIVNSKSEEILSVELFDLSGRIIHKNEKVNAKNYQIKSTEKGVLVVKVQTQTGEILTKKIISK